MHRWRIGDLVQVGFGSYRVSRLRIGGIFANVDPACPPGQTIVYVAALPPVACVVVSAYVAEPDWAAGSFGVLFKYATPLAVINDGCTAAPAAVG